MTIEKDDVSIAITSILNELSGKIEISRAMNLKDFKGSESVVKKLNDKIYRIYVRSKDPSDCDDIFKFDVTIDSPIKGSVLYKNMDLLIDVEDKVSYSKKKLKIAETINRLLKKSILFPEYDKEI